MAIQTENKLNQDYKNMNNHNFKNKQLKKGMGAAYQGYYSHLFSPTSQNGNYKGKNKKAIKLF